MKQALKYLAMPLALSVMVTTIASAASFTDTQGHWAQDKISQLSSHNVIGGYPDGSFKPEGTLTRAEFAAILVKSFKLPTASTGSSFYDVPASHWASPLIEAVQNAGLMAGYPGNQFKPNNPVSRAEVMAIMAKAYPPASPSADAATQILANYADGYQVPSWAQPAVAETIQTGIYANNPAYSSYIQANRAVTRAEVAAMTDNLLTKLLAYNGQNPNQNLANNSNTNSDNQQALQGYVVTIPADTEFSGSLTQPLSSETAKVGDTVTLSVDTPLVSQNNVIVVPNGSQLIGEVVMVDSASRLGDNGEIQLRFKEVVKSTGERYPIQGSVATEDGKGILEGGTAKGRLLEATKNTAIGAAAGAALGTALGPLSGGSVGKGAIYGSAIGGGLGAVKSAAEKGNPVDLQAGTRLKVKLDQPLQMPLNQQ